MAWVALGHAGTARLGHIRVGDVFTVVERTPRSLLAMELGEMAKELGGGATGRL